MVTCDDDAMRCDFPRSSSRSSRKPHRTDQFGRAACSLPSDMRTFSQRMFPPRFACYSKGKCTAVTGREGLVAAMEDGRTEANQDRPARQRSMLATESQSSSAQLRAWQDHDHFTLEMLFNGVYSGAYKGREAGQHRPKRKKTNSLRAEIGNIGIEGRVTMKALL